MLSISVPRTSRPIVSQAHLLHRAGARGTPPAAAGAPQQARGLAPSASPVQAMAHRLKTRAGRTLCGLCTCTVEPVFDVRADMVHRPQQVLSKFTNTSFQIPSSPKRDSCLSWASNAGLFLKCSAAPHAMVLMPSRMPTSPSAAEAAVAVPRTASLSADLSVVHARPVRQRPESDGAARASDRG
jgi:hypothetical protein